MERYMGNIKEVTVEPSDVGGAWLILHLHDGNDMQLHFSTPDLLGLRDAIAEAWEEGHQW
jgi:hypothetical protein